MVFTGFSATYAYTLYRCREINSELVRMGLAGSLANMMCEMGFHFADTVNVRAKTHHLPVSSYHMAMTIFKREGIYGFSKGISACYYGSIAQGMTYFTIYKLLKSKLSELNQARFSESFVFFFAALISEIFTLVVLYPYDTLKTRLQTMNKVYQYKNLIHAFTKEIRTHGLFSIYRGGLPFLTLYSSVISI
jgi:hypothetical protein